MEHRPNSPAFVVVDDDEDDRYFLRQAIAKSGSRYPVVEFDNGPDFLAYLTEELNQKGGDAIAWLVLMDLNMPLMNGKDVLTHMRQHPVWQRIPVIVLTGQDEPEGPTRLNALGATDYVVKTASLDKLAQHIQTTFAPWLDNPIRLP